MKLSACMITKDEERCIARCIDSYRAAVDEIIVVDTGSTDETRAIAQNLGARVFDFAWRDDFAAAKNEALAHATGDWVLFLDADEFFEGRGAQKLRQMLEKLPAEIEAVSLRRMELMGAAGTPRGATPFTPATRAFRCGEDIRYHGAIHEHLLRAGRPLHTVHAPPDEVTIKHDGYMGAVGRAKMQRNLLILERLQQEGDADPLLPFYLGQTLLPLCRYAEAWEYFERFLEKEREPTPIAMRALLGWERALQLAGYANPEEEAVWRAARRRLAELALARFPLHPTAHLIAGNAHFEQGDLPDALSCYQQAVKLREGFAEEGGYSENLADASYPAAHLRMAVCLREAGRLPAAEKSCAAALDLDPDLPGAAEEYLRCTRKTDARHAAAALLRWMDKASDKRAYLAAAHAVRCDLLYLIVYDKYIQGRPARDVYFTTMQVVVGELNTAVQDLVARFVQNPLWRGTQAGDETLPQAHWQDLYLALAEVSAATLSAQEVPLLERILTVAPPALYDAIALCLGRDVETLHMAGVALLPLISRRLPVLGASPEVAAMWREVTGLFGL